MESYDLRLSRDIELLCQRERVADRNLRLKSVDPYAAVWRPALVVILIGASVTGSFTWHVAIPSVIALGAGGIWAFLSASKAETRTTLTASEIKFVRSTREWIFYRTNRRNDPRFGDSGRVSQ